MQIIIEPCVFVTIFMTAGKLLLIRWKNERKREKLIGQTLNVRTCKCIQSVGGSMATIKVFLYWFVFNEEQYIHAIPSIKKFIIGKNFPFFN